MKLAKEDLWAQPCDMVVVTTNGVLNKHGHLVMGKGAALDAAKRFPDLPSMAGAEILRRIRLDFAPSVPQFGDLTYIYGFMPFNTVGLFQTKFHWRGKSDLELIAASCEVMMKHIRKEKMENVRMNFPGIGNGGLTMDQVLPVIQCLSDAVTVVHA